MTVAEKHGTPLTPPLFFRTFALESRFHFCTREIRIMTIDKSLRTRKGVSRSRNVLTRGERIEKLQQQDRWTAEDGVFGLPKVRVYQVVIKKKKKKVEEEGADDAKGKKK